MATFVNDLRLTELATGEGSGSWGTTTNVSLELIGEALGYATQQVFGSDANATTTVADGASDPARAMYFKVTSAGNLTATRTCTIAPNTVSRVMFIENATSGSQSIAISQGSGANVTILTGKTAVVYLDGAGSAAAVVDAMAGVDPGVTDTLTEVLVAGNASGGTNIELSTTDKVQFRDAAIYINSSADGQLDIVADTEIQIAATTIDINGAVDMASTLAVAGVVTANAGVVVDNITIDGNDISTTNSNGNLTLTPNGTGNVNINSDTLAITGTEGESASLVLAADESDDNADIWKVTSNTGNTLTIGNQISGSVVDHITITPNATVSNSTAAFAGKITAAGLVTANAGVKVDNFTLDGTTLALSSGDLTLDVAGDIIFDADGGDIRLKDGGAEFGLLSKSSTRFTIEGPDNPVRITTGTSNIQINHDTHITFDTANVERFRIAADGFGDYTSSSNDIIRFGGANSGSITFRNDTSNQFVMHTGASDDFVIGTGGNNDRLTITAAGAATFTGAVTANAGVVVDNITIDGTTIALSSGDLTLDVAGLIVLDAGNQGVVQIKDDGTVYGTLFKSGSNFFIESNISDGDISFRGSDGGSNVTALTLDMSAAGAATFNSTVLASGGASDNNDTAAVFKGTGSEHIKLLLDTSSSGGHQASIALESNGTQVSIGTTGSGELRHITNGAERFRIAVDGSLSTPTAGTDNVRFGENAGNSIASGGIRNVLIGKNAGTAITTGDSNVAVGWEALKTEDTHANSVAIGASALATQNAGADAYNVAVGYNAGTAITTGILNTLIGGLAGDAITTGANNVALGFEALTSNTGSNANVAIGFETLESFNVTSDTSTFNTAVGTQAGKAMDTGVENTMIGGLAGANATTTVRSVIIGYKAGHNATMTGNENNLVGFLSGRNITNGQYNIGLGSFTLNTMASGDSNIAIGRSALGSINGVNNNIAIGFEALSSNTSSAELVAIGRLSQKINRTGTSNTSVGTETLKTNVSGNNNTAMGYQALMTNTGADNTAFGRKALVLNQGGARNTAVGAEALDSNIGANDNTAVGQACMQATTTGGLNTAVGVSAMSANVGGESNQAFGRRALYTNESGSQNVAIGYLALNMSTTSYNTAVGNSALQTASSGHSNTAVGYACMDAVVTGNSNTAIGLRSSGKITGGDNNASIGVDALEDLLTGDNNSAMGPNALNSVNSGSNNSGLGNRAGIAGQPGGALTSHSNRVCLGDSAISELHCQVSLSVASDVRDKTEFTALDLGLDFVKELTPYTYKWDKRSNYVDWDSNPDTDLDTITHDGTHKEDWLDIGFKAQEVEALEIAAGYNKDNKTNLAVTLSGDEKLYGLQYEKFVPILVKAIQEQQTIIENLTSRLETLEG